MISRKNYNPLLFAPILMLLFLSCIGISICTNRIARMYYWSANFTIQSSYRRCEQPLNNRCVTHYDTTDANGEAYDFVPFGNQFEPDVLKVELNIEKSSKSFEYRINDSEEQWPYLWQHIFVVIIGVCGIVLWIFLRGPEYIIAWFNNFYD